MKSLNDCSTSLVYNCPCLLGRELDPVVGRFDSCFLMMFLSKTINLRICMVNLWGYLSEINDNCMLQYVKGKFKVHFCISETSMGLMNPSQIWSCVY